MVILARRERGMGGKEEWKDGCYEGKNGARVQRGDGNGNGNGMGIGVGVGVEGEVERRTGQQQYSYHSLYTLRDKPHAKLVPLHMYCNLVWQRPPPPMEIRRGIWHDSGSSAPHLCPSHS